ncbi:hypothetical protein BH24BAC1_BH24BAC1_41890 [soil metagenome]
MSDLLRQIFTMIIYIIEVFFFLLSGYVRNENFFFVFPAFKPPLPNGMFIHTKKTKSTHCLAVGQICYSKYIKSPVMMNIGYPTSEIIDSKFFKFVKHGFCC